MKKLGEKLREARLVKNISYEKIYKRTKIAIAVIQAIEEGKAGYLPRPQYRAFVKGIAKIVYLDGDSLLREFDSRQRRFEEEEGILKGTSQSKTGIWHFLTLHQKIVTLFLTGMICVIVVGLYIRFGKSLFVEPQLPPSIPQASEWSTLEKDITKVPFILEAVSHFDSRIYLELNGTNVKEMVLSRGQKMTWQVDSVIVIHLQNPENITLSLNGKDLGLQPDSYQPMAYTISSNGIIQQSISLLLAADQQENHDQITDPNILEGRISANVLFEQMPEFDLNRILYQPDTSLIIQIARHQSDIRLMAFLGTWDSISAEVIPIMFKVLQDSRLSEIPVQLIGVDTNLNDGLGYTRKYAVKRVPTVILFYGKQELGRITGYPERIMEDAIYQIVKKSSLFKRENDSGEYDSLYQDVRNGE